MPELDMPEVRLGRVTLRQTDGFAKPTETLPVPELSDAQKSRLARQQLFRDSFAKLEELRTEIDRFSLSHHYFKDATKQAWVSMLSDALDGMRAFLPRSQSQEDVSPE